MDDVPTPDLSYSHREELVRPRKNVIGNYCAFLAKRELEPADHVPIASSLLSIEGFLAGFPPGVSARFAVFAAEAVLPFWSWWVAQGFWRGELDPTVAWHAVDVAWRLLGGEVNVAEATSVLDRFDESGGVGDNSADEDVLQGASASGAAGFALTAALSFAGGESEFGPTALLAAEAVLAAWTTDSIPDFAARWWRECQTRVPVEDPAFIE